MEKTLGKMTFSASTHISESRSSRIRTHSTVAAGPPSVKEVCLTSKLESSNHFHLELLLKKARRSKVNQPPRALFILRQKNFFSFSLSLSLSLSLSQLTNFRLFYLSSQSMDFISFHLERYLSALFPNHQLLSFFSPSFNQLGYSFVSVSLPLSIS